MRRVATEDLTEREIEELRSLFDRAWSDDPEGFADEDWAHAVGGLHFIEQADGGGIVAHASVVERELQTGGHRLATGYVEAVATHPSHQRRGLGSTVMREVAQHIDATFSLGALGGDPGFYEPLGWIAWRGPTFVRTDEGLVRTREEDGSVLVRLTPSSPELDIFAPISCGWRSGDVW